MKHLEERLQKYLPEGTISFVIPLLLAHKVKLVLTRERASKLGDYRHPHAHHGHTITLNVTLGPYQFLVTLVHELAHLLVWEKHKNQVAPHGLEWKQCFGSMMIELAKLEHLPVEFRNALIKSARNPGASSVTDRYLFPVLKQLDPQQYSEEGTILLSELTSGNRFIFKGVIYTYVDKRRTRIVAKREDGATFLINHFATVTRLD